MCASQTVMSQRFVFRREAALLGCYKRASTEQMEEENVVQLHAAAAQRQQRRYSQVRTETEALLGDSWRPEWRT